MGLRGYVKAIVVLIIAAWLISPIPEVTLIIGFLTSWLLFESYSITAVLTGAALMMIPIYIIMHELEARFNIEERVIAWMHETDSDTLHTIEQRFSHAEEVSSGSSNK